MRVAPALLMAERAILTGLVTLVLLMALAKMGPNLKTSFEKVGAYGVEDPTRPIDHKDDEHRAHKVLEAYNIGQDEEDER
ncbi:MAG: hypothetical protein AAF296_11940 [Pseudomonadota bacterium]